MAVYKRPTSIADAPSGYCPGCLHSLATKLVAEAIEELGQADNSLNIISVGCSGLNILYWSGDFLSTAHGRALRRQQEQSEPIPKDLFLLIRETAILPQ